MPLDEVEMIVQVDESSCLEVFNRLLRCWLTFIRSKVDISSLSLTLLVVSSRDDY